MLAPPRPARPTPPSSGTVPAPRPAGAADGRRRAPLLAVARWSARHRALAVVGWVALVALCLALGSLAGSATLEDSESGSGASKEADSRLGAADFGEPPVERVLVTALDPAARGQADVAAAAVVDRLRALPQVRDVAVPVAAPDGRSVLVSATLAVDTALPDAEQDERAAEAVAPVLDATAQTAATFPGLRIEQAGDASLDVALEKTYADDFRRAEISSVPVTLIVLIVTFGALLAAAVPVLLALTAVAAAMGLSALTSHLVPTTETASSVILLIGMAVGVDYSLFYLRREREERQRGVADRDAVEIAAATAGHAVLVSGVTVVIAMAGMFLAGNAVFSSLAMGTILVVAVAVVGSLTVLPAVLATLGRHIDRPRVPLVGRLGARMARAALTERALGRLLRRPVAALLVGGGLLVALAVPAAGMRTSFPGVEDLPDSIPAVAAYSHVTEAFPQTGAAHVLAVWAADDASVALPVPALTAAAADLDRRTAADPRFATAAATAAGETPQLEVARDGRTARLVLPLVEGETSDAAVATLADLRATLVPATLGAVPGVDWGVAGATASTVDFSTQQSERLPLVIGFVLALTFVVLFAAFRSVPVAVVTLVLNLLSVGAAYGLLTLVFQHTWAEGLLGFTSTGTVVAWLPLFLFVVLFGLSLDYHVLVVSRIREHVRAGMPARDAVRAGTAATAGTVTSAAAVMVAVFAIFATLSAIDFKQMGVGLAAAILIDATLIRTVLLPASLTVLGERAWKPAKEATAA